MAYRLKDPVRRRPAVLVLVALLAPACATWSATLARPDRELFPPPPRDAITFWGHACCYIDVAGSGIVTDPVFEEKLHVRRRKVPAPPPEHYARTRLILISHAHDDHLSPQTLATFPESALVLCPLPAAEHLKTARQTVRALQPGDQVPFPGGTVIAVAAHHPGGRMGVHAEADGRALGYVIRTPGSTLFYSGDTDDFAGFDSVRVRYQPTLALLNINGHLHSMEAVRAARAVGAGTIVPLHWGAYGYGPFHEQRQPRDVETLRSELGPALVLLGLGASLPLPAPAPR